MITAAPTSPDDEDSPYSDQAAPGGNASPDRYRISTSGGLHLYNALHGGAQRNAGGSAHRREDPAGKKASISVTVNNAGAIFVDKRAVPLEDLPAMLTGYPGVNSETGVLLFADRQVAYQQLFEVLDRIRQAGLHRISLQAELKETR
jgi:hypothetical protein